MKVLSSVKSVLLIAGLVVSLNAKSTVILSTDFEGSTSSGVTASSIDWTTLGLTNPGDLTVEESAVTSPSLALFTTNDADGVFAVDRNIHNEGSWFVDINFSLMSGVSVVELSTFMLDAMIFNNSGNIQSVQRDLDVGFELFGNSLSMFSGDVLDIFAGNGTNNPIARPVSFDLSGLVLNQGVNYTIRLTAFGAGPGNNAGFDNLNLSGNVSRATTAVSEPSMAALFILAVAGLLRRRLAK